jgi:hypothetical protein
MTDKSRLHMPSALAAMGLYGNGVSRVSRVRRKWYRMGFFQQDLRIRQGRKLFISRCFTSLETSSSFEAAETLPKFI